MDSKITQLTAGKVPPLTRARLSEGMKLSCQWLTQRAQLRQEPAQSPDTIYHHPQLMWKGCFREYDPQLKEWKYYAPCWHTGQTVRALVLAHRVLPDEGYLESARLGAEFLRGNQIASGEDAGMLLAFESKPGDIIPSGGMLLSLRGLMDFAQETGESHWWGVVTGVLEWHLRKAYMPGAGCSRNYYHPAARAFQRHAKSPSPAPEGGRPLLNDGIWLRAYQHTGNRRYRDVALEIADRLVRDENPPGNWASYGPSNLPIGYDHGRQAYWFGLPMLMVYDETGDRKYLELARRTARWHMNAQRRDGGQFRNTYHDGKTESFMHETSGAACAAIVLATMCEHPEAASPEYYPYIRRALEFCLTMQITRPRDENLLGAVICGVFAPDGSDTIPFRVRDIDAIFFVQAAAQLLANENLAREVLAD